MAMDVRLISYLYLPAARLHAYPKDTYRERFVNRQIGYPSPFHATPGRLRPRLTLRCEAVHTRETGRAHLLRYLDKIHQYSPHDE